jgi:hypothetical protein
MMLNLGGHCVVLCKHRALLPVEGKKHGMNREVNPHVEKRK